MNNATKTDNRTERIVLWAALGLLLILEFRAHRITPFMLDDNWYSTNLATGEPLRSFSDIIEGQIWHYMNWGGRSITHGILQLVLMTGELMADILNVIMMLLLTWMMCIVTDRKTLPDFVLMHALLFAFNANIFSAVLWQSGGVNYVYSSCWILLFLWPYFRLLKDEAAKDLPFVNLWIVPIGLMTGWSNENMGPTCFLIAAFTLVLQGKVRHKKLSFWSVAGTLVSLLGSALCILAPGNFYRSSFVETPTLYERFLSMLTAESQYLFPSVLFAALVFLATVIVWKCTIALWQWVLLAAALLSYGAMVLSPHYPDRATFGTMVFLIMFGVSLLEDATDSGKLFRHNRNVLIICFVVSASLCLLLPMNG